MIRQEKDCGIRASGIREVLGGKIRDDGGDHFAEAPSDPAGRIGLSVTLPALFSVVKTSSGSSASSKQSLCAERM
jgi:hypothetical protein